MPTIITRYFESADTAYAARDELQYRKEVPGGTMQVLKASDDIVARLTAESVAADTAAVYADRLAAGGAVLLVRAGYKPLGVAKIARRTMVKMGAVYFDELIEDVRLRDVPEISTLSVMTDHPHFLTRKRDPNSTDYFMADWPIPLISKSRPKKAMTIMRNTYWANWPIGHIVPGHKFMANFPIKHLIPGHKFMANFPFGHIVPGHKFMAGFPIKHIVPGHKFMAGFPIKHLIPGHKFMAKFPFGHLVPGGKRMANWPFPLLMSGETQTNSLVPGQKYMAKFPFAHIVPGHKKMAGFPIKHIVPGHRFMAKFPFAHIVPGHKKMAGFPFGHLIPGHKYQAKFPFPHIVPGHKYMANWILPHTKSKAA